jgi:hypothetical protein
VTATGTVKQIVSDPQREWQGFAPASETEIRELESVLGLPLLSEYIGLLRVNNCGEGEGEGDASI